jgi:2-polyprenyl-3-methyl-5-hydroxy-6-metoxy-1,4-benzoquinol methylase
MMDSTKFMEKFLQEQRFSIVKHHLHGDILDFGGNKGELRKHVKGKYTGVNYNYSKLKNRRFDTIVSLAVIEHMEVTEVYAVFMWFEAMLNSEGRICITTPAEAARLPLEIMSALGITDQENLKEHKHYWNEGELRKLAKASGLKVVEYRQFQFGLNQFMICERVLNYERS